MVKTHHFLQGRDDKTVAHAAVGEAGQWASLIDTSKLPAPHSSELCNSTRTEYKFMSLLKADMPLKDLAKWLGKYAGVTLTQ